MDTPVLMSAAAILCGIALFYIVVQRTRKRRLEDAGIDPTKAQF